MALNGEMALILHYFTEFVYDVVVKQLLVLPRFQNILFSGRELAFTFAICYRTSVCRLSVCLSVTLVRPTQPVEIFGIFFTIRLPRDSSFLMPKFVGGGRPFPLKFAFKVTHPLSNSAISTNIGS